MRQLLTGHDCISVQKQGWKGIKNSELLALAAKEFDLFITSDLVNGSVDVLGTQLEEVIE